MTILQLLNADGYICCSKIVIKAFGVFEALVLGKLCSVAQRFGYKEFYISMDKICEDIGLSEYQARGAITTLKEQGILSVERKGIPCRSYYTLHEDKVIEIIQSSPKKTSELEPKKLEDKQESGLGTFKVMKKDKNKDMEKEINNIVPPPQEPSLHSVEPSPDCDEAPVERPPFSTSSCVSSELLPQIQECHRQLHERWTSAGLPLSRASAQSYFTFSCRELKAALGSWVGKNLAPEELLDALDNYIRLAELIKSGGSWMRSVGGFEHFAKHTLDYLDGNFSLDSYRKGGQQEEQEDIRERTSRLLKEWGIDG